MRRFCGSSVQPREGMDMINVEPFRSKSGIRIHVMENAS